MEETKVNVEEIMSEIREKIYEEEKIDIDQVMKEIEEEAAKHDDIPLPSFSDVKITSPSISNTPSDSTTELIHISQHNRNEAEYLKLRSIIPYFRELGKGPKGFVKRVVRKFIKSIVLPMREEQDEFNTHAEKGIEGLCTFTDQLSNISNKQQYSIDHISEEQSIQHYSMNLLSDEMSDLLRKTDLHTSDLIRYGQKLENLQRLADQHSSDLFGHGDELAAHRNNLSSLNNQVAIILKKLEDQEERQKKIDKATDDISMTVARVIQHYMEPENRKIPTAVLEESNISKEDNHPEDRYHAIDYFRFENDFRGPQNEIMERQKIYLPYFRNKTGRIYDLGCGRGEFLRLLKEEKIPSFGMDMYSEYTITGKLYDIDIQQGDGIELLDKTDEIFGGIFCAQVIEHIGFQNIQKLCKLAYERLEEDAWLVLETPNPMCVSAMTNAFYVDPTHDKPVHPFMMEYLLKSIGFRDVEVIFPDHSQAPLPHIESDEIKNIEQVNHAIDMISNLVYGSQDYAVIGKK